MEMLEGLGQLAHNETNTHLAGTGVYSTLKNACLLYIVEIYWPSCLKLIQCTNNDIGSNNPLTLTALASLEAEGLSLVYKFLNDTFEQLTIYGKYLSSSAIMKEGIFVG